VRALYFAELNDGPLIGLHRWEASDMNFFDLWAREVEAGDWLTDKSLHPHLPWHRDIAKDYLEKYPQEKAELALMKGPDGKPVDASRILWDRWYGGKRFHQEPLYPYLLALTYKVFGPDVRWVFAWQLLLGTLSNVLVYLIARRYFGLVAAAVAGLLVTLCSPLVFFEMVLLRSSLITFTGLLLVYLTEVALERRSWKWWMLLGTVLGLAILAKLTFALFGLGILCLLACNQRHNFRQFWLPATALVAGTLACLLPPLGRNLAVGAPATSLSSVGPITYVGANAPDYRPEWGFFISKHVPTVFRKSGDKLFPTVIETLKKHGGFSSYFRQLWGKFFWAWNWYEKPNNVNFYYYRLHSAVLRYLPVTFWILAPLGIAGLLLAAARFSVRTPLVATHFAPLLLFYVLSRFRTPLAAALIPFAALTIVQIAAWFRGKQFARCALVILCVGLLFGWSGRALPEGMAAIRRADYNVPFKTHYIPVVLPLAEKARRARDWQEVATLLEEILRHEPPFIRQVGLNRSPGHPPPEARQWVTRFAHWHGAYSEALGHLERSAEAQTEERRAKKLLRAAQEAQ
jgi:4-amino-4-deoxy-L-arabinose transferase-like glycosyltransferase